MTMRNSIAAARISGPSGQADGAVVFEFRFGADDPVFAGHFPAHPLLPGVFQLEMTRASAEWALHCPLALNEVSKAKFQRPILPEEIVRV
jgi:3-hydroxymyristoyl/3-hydroxydecanoyl-(acyl carrier protein) dehydratase